MEPNKKEVTFKSYQNLKNKILKIIFQLKLLSKKNPNIIIKAKKSKLNKNVPPI